MPKKPENHINRFPRPNGALMIIGGAEEREEDPKGSADYMKERHLEVLQ